MSKETGESRETSGEGSSQNSVEDGDASSHVVGYVSTEEEKPQLDHLTAFLQAQKQGFECEDTEKPEDDVERLKAKNRKRVEEMLQKAQEDLQKRKEKCTEEDTDKNKKVEMPDDTQHHDANKLEVFRKMAWLRNQNIHTELGRSCKTENTDKNINEVTMRSVPLKRQESDEYFKGTKESKNKGRRRNRTEAVISMEELERPLLKAVVQQKYMEFHQKPSHAPRHREHMYQTSPVPELTCWRKKSGADLFSDVPTQTLTICGAKSTEDELMKLAIKESLETYEAEKQFIVLAEAKCPDPFCPNTKNGAEVVQFLSSELVEDESWDPPESTEEVRGPCLLEEMKPAVSGQMQETVGNKVEHQDREMGAKKPQLSRQSGDVIVSKQKTGTSIKYVKCKGRNGILSDRFESGSRNKENDITNGEVRQPRSEHRVDDDTDNNGGDLTHFIEGECEEGIWGPFRNEVCNRQQKDNQHGTKKQGQKCKNPVPEPCINKGENKPENYMPEAIGCRAQVQVEWNQKKGQIEVQEGDRNQILFQPVPDAHRARREVMPQTYVPEASDRGTEVQVDWNQKRDEIEIQKGHQDQKLSVFLPGPCRNRRESIFHDCMPEADDSRAQLQTDWNHEKSMAESWKVHNDHVPVSLAVGRGRPQEVNRVQENCNSNNQNYVNRNLVYCSDEKLMTDKYNEWNGKKRQGDIWIDFVAQDADICRKEETSSFGRKEKLSKSEKGMIEHCPGKKSEDSGMCVCTSYDNKVQSDLGKCINKIESSAGVNDNSCYLQVNAEQSFNTNPVSLQNSPQDVRMLSTSCIHDIHLHQTCSPCVVSPGNTSQVHHATNAFWPSMPSTAGLFHGSDSLTTMAGIGSQPHAQHISNQASESSSQPLLVSNFQELFEAFVQELQWRIMSTNQMLQMTHMNSPGSRNMNPTGLPNSESNLKLQGQQMNSVPLMAPPINPLGGLPTNSNDLLLQSHNALLKQSAASVLNPWLLGVNQVVASSNVPIQPVVSSSGNRNGNIVQMPNSHMYSSGTVSPDPSVFLLNHASQANYPNIYQNNADNMPLDTPAFTLNRGTQANHPPCISPVGISPSYMMPQNFQSSQSYQPAVGSMQNTQQIAPIMYNQPLGVRPADEVTSSKMVIGKGRGRLLH